MYSVPIFPLGNAPVSSYTQATVCLALALICLTYVRSRGEIPAVESLDFQNVSSFLEKHCFECHDETTKKGGVRLDDLEGEFSRPEAAVLWTAVFDQISTAKMPPAKKPKPQPAVAAGLEAWIKNGLLAAEAKASAQNGRTLLRRLNRNEYENSVRDLLGSKVDLKEMLPEDVSLGGFDNIADAQNSSAILLERYLEAADHALDDAITSHVRPETKSGTYRYDQRMIPAYLAKSVLDRGDAMIFFGNVFFHAPSVIWILIGSKFFLSLCNGRTK